MVRYCSYREIGYFVSVQFDPACRWSKAHFRPQHLLDMEQLIHTEGARPWSGECVGRCLPVPRFVAATQNSAQIPERRFNAQHETTAAYLKAAGCGGGSDLCYRTASPAGPAVLFTRALVMRPACAPR